MVFRWKTQRVVGWRCTTTRAWKDYVKTKVGKQLFVDPELAEDNETCFAPKLAGVTPQT
jgi:hypothetical protein